MLLGTVKTENLLDYRWNAVCTDEIPDAWSRSYDFKRPSIVAPGFWISFVKKFRTWPKSPNFAKFRPKFIFRLFLKILLNIFKLLFLKFSNFGGGQNHRISWNFAEILNTGCDNYNLKIFVFAIVLWGLWTVRNKHAIEGKFHGKRFLRLFLKLICFCRNGNRFWGVVNNSSLKKWCRKLGDWWRSCWRG